MKTIAPVTIIIPTYNRGMKVLSVLEKIRLCDPTPAAIIIHVDLSDGNLEAELNERFPDVAVLTSSTRRGPGGGRHRCLLACKTAFAVSFDDDSYPVDSDFFATVERLFLEHPCTALLEANIWHRNEPELLPATSLTPISNYMGCGYAIRLDVYRQMRGHLDRPVPYGIEESDLSLQLFVSGWQMKRAGELRVFHDTELKHHRSAEITAGSIANVALYGFLHYPVRAWGLGLAQLTNKVFDCLRKGRFAGILSGLLQIPGDCYRNRVHRNPVPWKSLKRYVEFRRAERVRGES
jgi:glycosyltransferase involved in cell wall biosynthesis